MDRILRLPSALIALVKGRCGRLFRTAFGAEFSLIYRTAGTGPAVGLRLRALCAAFRAKLSGNSRTAGAGPAVGGRLRLRLFGSALRAELSSNSVATGAGPAVGSRCSRRWLGRRLRYWLIGLLRHLLLCVHLIEALGIDAPCCSCHIHTHEGHSRTCAGIGGGSLHSVALCLHQSCGCSARISKPCFLAHLHLLLPNLGLYLFIGLHAGDAKGNNLQAAFLPPRL